MKHSNRNPEDDEDSINESKDGFTIKNYVYNLIRTTQRNYIDLTNIADNKANILISINSLMLTILIPIVLSNYDIIVAKMLYIPLAFLAISCLTTIIMSALVLVPFKGDLVVANIKAEEAKRSPFFFTSYADLSLNEYRDLFQKTVGDKELTSETVVSDLYYFGKLLSVKYSNVKKAYRVFNFGLLTSFITFLVIFFLH